MGTTEQAKLTFGSGGWVLLVAFIIAIGIIGWSISGLFMGMRPVGDGRTVDSYGFALENLGEERAFLVSSGQPRDFLQSIDDPEVMAADDVAHFNAQIRGKYLVSADRVIGVSIDGVHRAYPIRVMNAHEICNDMLADVPIVVTFSPLCDSAVVFNRTVDGRERAFGVSGLLLNSNLVMYEKTDDPVASPPGLWSQLLMKSISGSESGTALDPIPGVCITTWSEWKKAHPDTTVIKPDPESMRRYKSFSYMRYLANGRLDYPVRNAQEHADQAIGLMSPILVVSAAGQTRSIRLDQLTESDGAVTFQIGGAPVTVAKTGERSALVESDADVLTVPTAWFAWASMHPGSAADWLEPGS